MFVKKYDDLIYFIGIFLYFKANNRNKPIAKVARMKERKNLAWLN